METAIMERPAITIDLAKANRKEINALRRLQKEQRRHEINTALLDTAKAASANPIITLLAASLVNQYLYNKGAFNPHDPNHTKEEDWEAGSNVSDWIFFATLAVAANQAAKAAADIFPSIKSVIFG